MNTDPRNVIATEDICTTCGTDTIHVYHQKFPELRIGGRTSEEAAERLANRLERSLDTVQDPLHQEPVRQAITDIRAFLGREGNAHPARDL